ncbi:hypothetical protein NPX13_g7606 [Xylaria arbuscula]|uniref:Uncharacterized protein n=1 Tax=Xylaria arbuscula TaxID=114810 RepID=A0A9W8TL09_9PEZI|nr:hypothetical protein NPX13_g7606 [Xylaria arbuscula]
MSPRSPLPQRTPQDVEDLRVVQRLHREQPELNLEKLIDALRKELDHEPSPLVLHIAAKHFDPFDESRSILHWKRTGRYASF